MSIEIHTQCKLPGVHLGFRTRGGQNNCSGVSGGGGGVGVVIVECLQGGLNVLLMFSTCIVKGGGGGVPYPPPPRCTPGEVVPTCIRR